MKRITFILFVLFGLLPPSLIGGNDVFINSYQFAAPYVPPVDLSGDSHLQGCWRFEGNLNDSSGKGNNLTASGTISYSMDTLIEEGIYSAYQTGSNYAYRTNADLGATFPGKTSTSTTSCSITGWFRSASYATDMILAAIGNISTTKLYNVDGAK
jgi:hypothetical protein